MTTRKTKTAKNKFSLAEKPCPVCGHNDFKLYRHVVSRIKTVPQGLDRGHFVEARVERCGECGLFRTVPVSDLRDVKELYTDDSVCFEASASKLALGAVSASSTDELSLLSVKPPAKFLDVGCGAGHLLYRAKKKGYEVMGLDLDPKAVKSVREDLGFEAHCGTLETLSTKKTFDVITMMGVLEHLESPREILKEAAKHLNMGGEIVIGVPNPRSLNRWLARLSPHDWDMFIEPGHLYHYDVQTLTRLAETAGLSRRNWITGTMAIRGKIPLMPARNTGIEEFVRENIGKSKVLRRIYLEGLRFFDHFKLGDMLFVSFERNL